MENGFTVNLRILVSDLYKGLKKFGYIIIIFASLLSGICFFISAKDYTPEYTARATFTILAGYEDNYTGYNYGYFYKSQTASQMALTFPYILQSNILQEIVAKDLGVSVLDGSINAMAVPDTNLFTMMVTSTNPQDAYNILNAVIKNYPKVAVFVIGDTKMNILSSPSVPEIPDNKPSYARMTKIGFFAGCVLGFGCIFFYALTRRTIRGTDDLKNKLNIKCLGIMPQVKFKRRSKSIDTSVNLLNSKIGGTFKESVRVVRTHILKEIENSGAKVLVVTSTVPQEGKTTVSVNLAVSLAQIGYKVILADADLRNPSLLKALDIPAPCNGLGEVLDGRADIRQSVRYLGEYGIHILAGRTVYDRPGVLFSCPAMPSIISELKRMADFIIIDTPPCCTMPDAAIISKYADLAIYAIRHDYAKTGRIIDSVTSLAYSDVKLLGAVLTYAEVGFGIYGYRYGYSYKSYYKGKTENEHIV